MVRHGWYGGVYLEDDERERVRRELAEELGCVPSTVFTRDELVKELRERLRSEGVPERILDYIDYDAMIGDMMQSGDLGRETVEVGGEKVEVYWFTYECEEASA